MNCKDCGIGEEKREILEEGLCVVCRMARYRSNQNKGNWKTVINLDVLRYKKNEIN